MAVACGGVRQLAGSGRKTVVGRWPCGLNLNVVFLLSMVATNLLSLYHLSIRASPTTPALQSGSDFEQQQPALEFLWYDADRVLRPGGLLWVDHLWCRKGDLDGVYAAMLRRLGYKTIKWAVADKTGIGAKDELVYLTALLQKPF
ncbi:hypothetical protein TRIUR3_32847 [Triticum urartu]|uniref:Methyltransferase n=1 Tax=Triticum urartu TaxID=4572 RepID=M7Z062_TRIUA|nr:hypothetical protein TRIUR3_32847 [Triticum urartu]